MVSGAGCAIQCGDMKWNWILPMFDGELRNLQAKFSLSCGAGSRRVRRSQFRKGDTTAAWLGSSLL